MLIIFDYDGTLHNTAKLYANAVRGAYSLLVQKGFAENKYYSDEYLSKYLGFTAKDMWDDFMPDLPCNLKELSAKIVGENMINGIKNGEASLYDGVPEMLDNLKKYCRLVILSNCDERYMNAHREYFWLDKWFDDYYTAEKYDNLPKELIIPKIKESYPNDDYIVIGDRLSDFTAAQKNGIQCIGCTYGFGTAQEYVDCDFTVDSPSKISSVFASFF